MATAHQHSSCDVVIALHVYITHRIQSNKELKKCAGHLEVRLRGHVFLGSGFDAQALEINRGRRLRRNPIDFNVFYMINPCY